MDLNFASDSDLEIFSKTLERLKIPECNLKMEENPMIEATASTSNPVEAAAMDIPESSTQQDLDLGMPQLQPLGEQPMYMKP